MKNMGLVWAVAAAMAAGSLVAEEQAPAAASPAPAPAAEKPAEKAPAEKTVVKQEKPVLVDLELTGKVIQQEKTGKNKEGAEVKTTLTVLETADGQVVLPKSKNGPDLATFVGKDVKVTGKGTTEVNKKGKKVTRLMKLDKIEAVAQ